MQPMLSTFQINDIFGHTKSIQNGNGEYEWTLDLSAFPSGVYFLIAYDKVGRMHANVKVIKLNH